MTQLAKPPDDSASKPVRKQKTLDLTVLAGGPSAEREVSLQSGAAVTAALVRLGHRVNVRDINPENLSALDVPADFVFIALHGAFGEDGQVQDLLARRGIAFCGSDAAASALAMNKAAAKARLVEAGVPTPRYHVFRHPRARCAADRLGCWRLPVVIKPVNSGSSVDTYIARDAFAFQSMLERVSGRHGTALIEQYVHGPELTVGIIGDQALPVCQIRTRREFYDYQAKYIDDDTEYLFDIDLPADLLRRIQDLSVKAHDALGCRDFSRVDWMVDARTLEPYVLEINTIPGFTSHSLLPKAAARVGISFDQLCQRIIELGLARHGR
ncbi:MAG TPA: D-alanine--D-alanine ligase [Phycisphaerae bacterium]|nr:D-alanine--D-alanine ligase [Phycisphaerae bacterium]